MSGSATPHAFGTALRIVRKFLGFENRWRLFLAQLLVTLPAGIAAVGSVNTDASFLSEHSAFFQTIAQVQAGVLVAFALTQFGDDDAARGVRPAVIVAVLLGAVALAAGVAGTTPLLPRSLQRWAFGLAIGGGAGSLVSLAYVSWRLLR